MNREGLMDDFHESRFTDSEGALRRRGTDPMLEVIAHKVTKMEASMDKVADALTKLAVIEERQTADRAALERAFTAIQTTEERCAEAFEKTVAKLEKIEARVDTLEQAAPITEQTNEWVSKAMWAAAAAFAMYVAKKLGIV
jgi:chromosome segregation ATPase